MRVEFVERENMPDRLVAEAELHFDEGPLAGMKLVGFCIWRADSEDYATFPARAFGIGNERRYFDYLRAQDGTAVRVREVKRYILDAWREHKKEASDAGVR